MPENVHNLTEGGSIEHSVDRIDWSLGSPAEVPEFFSSEFLRSILLDDHITEDPNPLFVRELIIVGWQVHTHFLYRPLLWTVHPLCQAQTDEQNTENGSCLQAWTHLGLNFSSSSEMVKMNVDSVTGEGELFRDVVAVWSPARLWCQPLSKCSLLYQKDSPALAVKRCLATAAIANRS